MSDVPDAAVCGACGEQQLRLEYGQAGVEAHPACHACGHQPSDQVYRENRIDSLLGEVDLPDESGVVWSENLPETASGEEGAVVLMLGPREWDSLRSRASLEFHEGVDIEVEKGVGPGVGFGTSDSGITSVTIRLPGEAAKELHQTGRWSASVGSSTGPLHMKVVVQADA